MKKRVSILLSALMLLGLFAGASAEEFTATAQGMMGEVLSLIHI